MNETVIILLLMFFLLLWFVFAIIYGSRRAKERQKKTEDDLKLRDDKLEIVFSAYKMNNNFYHFVSLFKNVSEGVFTDQRIVKVIKEEIKKNFNNVYDFVTIKNSIKRLPKENKLLFELFFIQVLREIDEQFLKNLYRQAVNTNEEEAKKGLEEIFKKMNLSV